MAHISELNMLGRLHEINPAASNNLEELKDLLLEAKHVLGLLQENLLIVHINTQGKVVSVSPLMQTLLQSSITDFADRSLDELTPPIVKHSAQNALRALEDGQVFQYESHIVRPDDDKYHEIWLDTLVIPLFDTKHQLHGGLVIYKDLTAQRLIERLSTIDELTSAYNRRYFNQIFPKLIQESKEKGYFLCFMMIDVDNFKKYNDTYGHAQGDEVLKQVVDCLQETFVNETDLVFRLGGEEFAALFSVHEPIQAIRLADQARQHLYDLNIDHTGNLPYHRVTLSAGLMILDPKEQYITEEIYKYADEALYRAKAAGRNQIEQVNTQSNIELF